MQNINHGLPLKDRIHEAEQLVYSVFGTTNARVGFAPAIWFGGKSGMECSVSDENIAYIQ